jgi:hypothetical protein
MEDTNEENREVSRFFVFLGLPVQISGESSIVLAGMLLFCYRVAMRFAAVRFAIMILIFSFTVYS